MSASTPTSPFLLSTRVACIVLLFLTGINALTAGALFIYDPSGKHMGMSVDYLASSPFRTYLIPGITLFTVNGLFNVIAAFLSIRKHRGYPGLIILQGLLLSGWILVQVVMVRDFNGLHTTMLVTGLLLMAGGAVLRRNRD